MIDDDDLFVVIVDDDLNDADTDGVYKQENEIKRRRYSRESFDDEEESKYNTKQETEVKVENILYVAQEYGEILHLNEDEDNKHIQNEFDMAFDMNYDSILDDDDDDEPQFVCDDDQSSTHSLDNDEIATKWTGTGTHWKNRDRVMVSYVQKLKEKLPYSKNNKEHLIQTIAQKMRNTYPPEPPSNYASFYNDNYRCKFCDTESPTEPIALRHYQEKHGERYLFCYACGATFRSNTNLYKHEKLNCQSGDISIVLKARALSLGRKGRSRPFLQKQRKGPRERYSCTECTATFLNKNSLEPHLRMHRGERPFLCPNCPRAYTSYVAMTHHMKKHGDMNYICDYCGRVFKEKGKIVVHLASHSPVKRFGCEECPKRYSTKADLLVHVNRDHRDLPPPFDCKICPKRFARMATLKCHMKKNHGMIMITSKMFARQLPQMSQKQLETQLQQAVVVFKNTDNIIESNKR